MKTISGIMLLCFLILQHSFAQDKTLLTEKQGNFKTKYNIANGFGADSYGVKSSYTNTDLEAVKKNSDKVVEIFRRIPVLAGNKGFDAYSYSILGVPNSKFGYGMQLQIAFFFETWSLRNGKEVKHTIEPPQFRFQVNETDIFCSDGFNVSDNSNSSTRTNPDFTEQATTKATVALRELFFIPGKKIKIAPGIDCYADNYVIYNPEMPDYWVQVTIREVYRRVMDYWKYQPDVRDRESMLAVVEKQFSQYTEAEKDGFAYRGGKDMIYKIGTEKNEFPVLIPNPEYWNRNLPRSAIQFITIEIPDDATIKQKLERTLKNNDGYYYVYKLFSELDLNSLSQLIDK
jgi:hypothetical protein